ncbi:MAG: PEP-CTERM sorting domain-containing protein [Verrucomicrobiales bacterium]
MKNASLTLLCALGIAGAAPAATFYNIASVSANTAGTDLWPASNLIQGPGAGFDAAEPHNQLGGGDTHRWVTTACSFPCDYYSTLPAPVLTFDLGSDRELSEISVWGYTSGNTNGVKDFSLKFGTSAEGAAQIGTSITFNPSFTPVTRDDVPRNSFPFSETVTARFVQMTLTDNYFVAPGDIAPNNGGDRVGMGEVAFRVIPEPSTALLSALAGLGLLRRRRRS